jgi:hypothetical protein
MGLGLEIIPKNGWRLRFPSELTQRFHIFFFNERGTGAAELDELKAVVDQMGLVLRSKV